MARFFRLCAEADEVELIDLLLRRYGTIPDLPAGLLMQLITTARKEKKREELYLAWVALLPLMQEGKVKYKGFEEYYQHCTGGDIDRRSAEDILAEVEEIRAEIRKEKNNG